MTFFAKKVVSKIKIAVLKGERERERARSEIVDKRERRVRKIISKRDRKIEKER
jgi:hypothetical protein